MPPSRTVARTAVRLAGGGARAAAFGLGVLAELKASGGADQAEGLAVIDADDLQ